MKATLASIRKSLVAGFSALATAGSGLLTADNMNLANVTQAQVSTVLFGALVTAMATFAVSNKAKAVAVVVEQKVADAGASAFTSSLQPHLVQLQADLAAAIAPLAAGAHAKPETPTTPTTPGGRP